MKYMTNTNTMSRTTPQTQTFTFGNETSSPVRPGRKHRRGRGYKNAINNAANNRNTGASPVQSSSLSTRQPQQQSQPQQSQPLQPQANYAFSTGDAWNNNNNNNASPHKGLQSYNDDGSLAYSASSSVQSAESSNDSSFAEIFKVIGSNELDNTAEGSSSHHCEIKDFIAKQSKAANSVNNDSSIRNARWIQRNPGQQQQHHQPHQQHRQQRKKQQPHKSRQVVDWNYSKDSSDDLDENLLETIAGKRDEVNNNIIAHRVTVTSQHAANVNPHPFFSNDPFASNNNISPYNSAPSSPRTSSRHASSSGHVTPPPYTSRSNGSSSGSNSPSSSPISRTSSRHSKSSSDGSFDTPIASSPPSSLSSTSSSKPPYHARGVMPMGKLSRRKSDEKNQVAISMENSLSEAFYAKSWMCGFTDSFNFDAFDSSFQK